MTEWQERCVIHLDMDCFYAQVEQIRLGLGVDVPLGVRQKRMLVTSNYAARARGVPKCGSMSAALRACPEMMVVVGEDLAPYRQASARVHRLLRAWPAPAERLGLDEFFLDVTELVEPTEPSADPPVCGCEDGTHERLLAAARLAEDMRRKIKEELGMTCCAGISHNKILAKLGGSLHKPDQQTVVYPCEAFSLMSSILSVKSIPGVGQKTLDILTDMKIMSTTDLQNVQLTVLEKRLGSDFAKKLKNLSFGIDPSPVKSSAPPAAIGVEDSYGDLCEADEVKRQLEILLNRLLPLIFESGRRPGGLRVSLQKCDQTVRRARQCNISPSLFKMQGDKINLTDGALSEFLSLSWDLFIKLTEGASVFHVAILGLAFTKLHDLKMGKSSITNYFAKNLERSNVEVMKNDADDEKSYLDSESEDELKCYEPPNKKICQKDFFDVKNKEKFESIVDVKGESSNNNTKYTEIKTSFNNNLEGSPKEFTETNDSPTLPPDVDEATFFELPEDLQKELITSWKNSAYRSSIGTQNKAVKNKGPNTILKYFVCK